MIFLCFFFSPLFLFKEEKIRIILLIIHTKRENNIKQKTNDLIELLTIKSRYKLEYKEKDVTYKIGSETKLC